MSKKHFEAAARYVRDRRFAMSAETADAVETAFAHIFAEFNERFDRNRFHDACRGKDARD